MKARKRNPLKLIRLACFAFGLALVVSVLNLGSTNLWFVEKASASSSTSMGSISLEMNNQKTALNTNGSGTTATFSIANNSNIPSYVRVGYTFVYKDSSGKTLPVAIPEGMVTVTSADVSLTGNSSRPNSIVEEVNVQGYEKNMIGLYSDSGSTRAKIAPEVSAISGKINVDFDSTLFPIDLPASAKLYIIVSPEAIQGTESALNEFSEYGW